MTHLWDSWTRATVLATFFAFGFVMLCNVAVQDFIVDDGYITFHYADNLVETGSAYYNRGLTGPYGYTNPAYLFLLAALRLATFKFISFEILSRLIASAALFGIALVLFGSALKQTARQPVWQQLLCLTGLSAVLFLFPYLLPNFFSGLETPLFAASLCVLGLVPLTKNPKLHWLLYPALALALSLRIDSFVVTLPLLVWVAWAVVKGQLRVSIPGLALTGAALLLIAVVQVSLMGFQLPLSFGHKARTFDTYVLNQYLRVFAVILGPVLLLLVSRRSLGMVAFVAASAFYVALLYAFFVEWHFYRYIFPYALALFVMLVFSLFKMGVTSRRAQAVALLLMLVLFLPHAQQGYEWVSGYRIAVRNMNGISAALRAAQLDPKFQVFASYDAGYIAYDSKWQLIDLQGLTTPEVTHQEVGVVIETLQPTVLIVASGSVNSTVENVALTSQYQSKPSPLPENYRFVTRLNLANRYWWSNRAYGYFVFVNENAGADLVARLENISVDPEREIGLQRYVADSFALLMKVLVPVWNP